jgi:hypothetical protein
MNSLRDKMIKTVLDNNGSGLTGLRAKYIADAILDMPEFKELNMEGVEAERGNSATHRQLGSKDDNLAPSAHMESAKPDNHDPRVRESELFDAYRKSFCYDASFLHKSAFNEGWQASEARMRAMMQELVEALRKIEYESSMFLMHEKGAVSAGICNRIAREALTRISKGGLLLLG